MRHIEEPTGAQKLPMGTCKKAILEIKSGS